MINRRNPVLFVMTALLILGFTALPPYSVLDKMRLIGYAVCHQLPSRSFFMAGEQLPMCARNTGIFVGAFVGLLILFAMRKNRKVMLPPVHISFLLVVFIVFMGVDGVNSYLPYLIGVPHLYEPLNSLRLVTGTLAGITVSIFLFPAVNYVAWRAVIEEPVVESFKELGIFLLAALVIVMAILPEPGLLLLPVSLASGLGTLALMVGVSLIPVLSILGWDRKADNWQDLALPILLSLLIAILLIGSVDQIRTLFIGPLPDLK